MIKRKLLIERELQDLENAYQLSSRAEAMLVRRLLATIRHLQKSVSDAVVAEREECIAAVAELHGTEVKAGQGRFQALGAACKALEARRPSDKPETE